MSHYGWGPAGETLHVGDRETCSAPDCGPTGRDAKGRFTSRRLTQEPEQAWDEAHREDWARRVVAASGENWQTHLAKFDGTVLPREEAGLEGAWDGAHTLNRVVFDRDPDCGCTPPCGHGTYRFEEVRER